MKLRCIKKDKFQFMFVGRFVRASNAQLVNRNEHETVSPSI